MKAFIIGFILGSVVAFIISAYFYEIGREAIRKENQIIKI